MKKLVHISAALALSALIFDAANASASVPEVGPSLMGPQARHDCLPTVWAGRTLAVNGSFTFNGTLNDLSWTPVLPADWAIISVSGAGNPVLQGPQGPIVWGPASATSPISFTYVVQVPANAAAGNYSIHGNVAYSLGSLPPPTHPPMDPSAIGVTYALPDPLVVHVLRLPVPRTPWSLWYQHTCGTPAVWSMASTQLVAASYLSCGKVDPKWHIASVADVNHDGRTELRWQHEDGWLANWTMDGTNCIGVGYLNPKHVEPGWRMVGSAESLILGTSDILWQHTNGTVAVWYMNGTNCIGAGVPVPNNTNPQWKLVGAGRFNADAQVDLLWQHTDGSLAVWFMDGLHRVGVARLTPAQVDPSWKVVGIYDLNGDKHTEIIFQNTNGRIAYWVMDGTTRTDVGSFSSTSVDSNWHIVGPR